MKKYLFLSSLTILSVFIFNPITGEAQGRGSTHKWNGKLTYVHSTNFSSNNSKGHTIWTMEVVVENGKAKTFASEKFTKSGYCSNNGYSEGRDSINFPDITVNEEGKFSIDLPMPFIKGTNSTNCNGPQRTEKLWQNDVGLLVEDLKAGDDPDVLQGDSSSTETTNSGVESWEVSIKVSWSFKRGPQLELIVTPLAYDDWLPVPGKTDTEAGSQLIVGLRLQDKNGGETTTKVKSFEAALMLTSKLPGIALNAPDRLEGEPGFDMALQDKEQAVSKKAQKLVVPSTDGETGSFIINTFDGGASSTLVVEAVLENGKRIKGELLKSGGFTDILLPKRISGSKMAESWTRQNGNPGENDDNEKSPGNDKNGDGLTAFEEYRGLFSEGKFKRLDPRKKELGVQFKKTEKNIFNDGLVLLTNVSGIEVISLYEDELGDKRVINLNSEPGAHKQHALKLVREDIANDVAGYNVPRGTLKKTPKDSERAVINFKNLEDTYKDQLKALPRGITMPYTLKENIAVTVAHELGHGIYLDHHGPLSEITAPDKALENEFKVYDDLGNLIGDSSIRKGNIGKTGNDASGDPGCIMAYTTQYSWSYHVSAEGWFYYLVPLLPAGKKLCTNAQGTGINAGGKYFGNATTGNCLSSLKIRDE